MAVLDIILSVLLVYGLYKGFSKGLLVEVASLLSLLVGLYGAIHFSFFAENWLETKMDWDAKYIQIVAFAITFLGLVFLVSLVGKIVTKIIDAAQLGLLNKIAGAAFGLAKIALIVSVIINLFSKLNDTITFVDQDTLTNTILYTKVKNFAPTIFPSIMEEVENLKKNNPFVKEKDSII